MGALGAIALLLIATFDRSSESRVRLVCFVAALGMLYWSLARLSLRLIMLTHLAYDALDQSARMVGGMAIGMFVCLLILKTHKGKK